MTKLTKVTEFVGFVYQSDDGPQFASEPTEPWRGPVYLDAVDLAPAYAVSKTWKAPDRVRGRWRVTVEFEPEEER